MIIKLFACICYLDAIVKFESFPHLQTVNKLGIAAT